MVLPSIRNSPKNIYGRSWNFPTETLKSLFTNVTAAGVSELNKYKWDEYLGRAYLYWTPHEWLALSAEYQYEKIEYQEGFNIGCREE